MPKITLKIKNKPTSLVCNIYKSNNYISTSFLPTPIVKDFVGDEYIDTDIIENNVYYYAVSIIENDIVKVFNTTAIIASDTDIYFNLITARVEVKEGINSTIKDLSTPTKTITPNGASVIYQSKFNDKENFYHICSPQTSSNNSDNGSLRITLSKKLLTEDFTIEFISAFDSYSDNNARLFQLGTTAAGSGKGIWLTRSAATNKVELTYHNGTVHKTNVSSVDYTNNKYHEFCAMRKLGIFYLFQDGVLVAKDDQNLTVSFDSNQLNICTNEVNTEAFTGVIDSCRFTLGVARYNVNGYTPRTKPFEKNLTDDQYFNSVEFLIDASEQSENNFKSEIQDLSSKKLIVNRIGNFHTIVPLIDKGFIWLKQNSYFTISGQEFGKNDFTIECNACWGTQYNQWQTFFAAGPITSNGHIKMAFSNTNKIGLQFYNDNTWTAVLPTGWTEVKEENDKRFYNLCAMRKDGVFYFYVDGILIGSKEYPSMSVLNDFYIGRNTNNENLYNGYISALRVTKYARYPINGYSVPNKYHSK